MRGTGNLARGLARVPQLLIAGPSCRAASHTRAAAVANVKDIAQVGVVLSVAILAFGNDVPLAEAVGLSLNGESTAVTTVQHGKSMLEYMSSK